MGGASGKQEALRAQGEKRIAKRALGNGPGGSPAEYVASSALRYSSNKREGEKQPPVM